MKQSLLILFAIILSATTVFAQNTVKGIVKGTNGITIPGATITVRGTKIATITDVEGAFAIDAKQQPPFYIRVSYVGYKPQDFQILRLQEAPIELVLVEDTQLDEIVVTSRRRSEVLQDVPIPITVIGGQAAENAGAFNVNRLKELVPSVQLYASNARNTTLNIRGLGSTFGLTNDGIDPGVGFYVDGVYHARPAATSTDFLDIEQIEVIRGPQGTLFGKNTTAGAFNITTTKPTQTPTAKVEMSVGNYNFIQAKTSVSGGVAKNLAAKISISGTQRDGTIYNTREERRYSGQNNLGFKSQLYFTPSDKLKILLSGDVSIQHPAGYPLVIAGVTTTERSAYRQYARIVSDLGYQQPKINPFSREINTNTPWRHNQSIGGISLNVDYKIGNGTLTSTTAWRFWNWDPTNDRDFSELSALTKSQGNSRHDQYSQEIRYAGDITEKLSGVFGVFFLGQNLQGLGQTEEVGKDQWRFVQTANTGAQALYSTPGLLDGFGIKTNSTIKSLSAAVFGQIDWEVIEHLHVLPGLRFTYDKKDVNYDRNTYGGLQTTDPALLALKAAVYANQQFATKVDNNNLSGNITVSYRPTPKVNAYATFSTAYKPVGVNVGGLPTTSNGQADLTLAVVKPEYVEHYELGVKTKPFKGAILNVTAFNTDIKDYQTNVQSPQLGVNRGYLANAEKVQVKGLEIDGTYQLERFLTLNAALAYLDGKYVTFTNAPLPLEETGHTELVNGVATQVAFKDASGGRLPGISKWNVSGGAEFSTPGNLATKPGRYFIAGDASYRSTYSSNPTPSSVLNVQGYSLLNARLGFKSDKFSVFVWSRNLTNKNYYEQLQAAAGNSGLYAGVLGDPRTYGATFRYSF
ncbi:iron complex outermembrane receptor protein [Pedobacter psychrotolerans]|uniref:Iron complex outermembrane receptor protein n=1 Tax=Pedobacter psychrotolerans TaxID=1843235 RepID=A0A4R2H8L1_9SPHI|nr:TonB-dependent receptor [Pedobacter psychrotolerans]TCO22639.1 iron complex outermembrane receptor protein [Pedobacter psychrotolerans]GGE66015.1 TonB-dependent receptor [Pedobacter psychrotolerans]